MIGKVGHNNNIVRTAIESTQSALSRVEQGFVQIPSQLQGLEKDCYISRTPEVRQLAKKAPKASKYAELIKEVKTNFAQELKFNDTFDSKQKTNIMSQVDYLTHLLEHNISDSVIAGAIREKLVPLTYSIDYMGVKLLPENRVYIAELDEVTKLAEIPLSSKNRLYTITGDSYNYHKTQKENGNSWYGKAILRDLASTPKGKEFKHISARDMKKVMDLDPLKHFLQYYSDSNEALANHLYQNYYLTGLKPIVRNICQKISDQFGTKLFLQSEESQMAAQIAYGELSQWERASAGTCKFPTVINMNEYVAYFLNNPCARGCYSSTNDIHLKGDDADIIIFTLRHEMAHLNDDNFSSVSGLVNGVDFDEIKKQKLYSNEFFRSGLDPSLIEYAYKNKREFVAVAAQGDYSKYSGKFKELLVRLGLPEYVFDMEPSNPDFVENAKSIAKIRQKYPAIHTAQDLRTHYISEVISETDVAPMSLGLRLFVKKN